MVREIMNKIEAPVIDMKKTGEQISSLRKINDISVKQLQEYLGFATPQAIYKWEHGITLPSLDNLLFLSWIFGVSMNSIVICKNSKPLSSDETERICHYITYKLAKRESQNKSSHSAPNRLTRFSQGIYPDDKPTMDGMDKID